MKVTFDLDDAIDNRVFNAPEGYRRLTIDIPEEIHKKIKLLAIGFDTTVTNIIIDLIENLLRDGYFGENLIFKKFEDEVAKQTKRRGRPLKNSMGKKQ